MRPSRDLNRLGIIGLIVLGLVAVGLSAAALLQHRTVRAVPAATASPTSVATPRPTQTPTPTPTPKQTVSETPLSPEPVPSISVVIVGDSHSLGDPAETWVGPAAEKLHWDPVVNLSAPGRGFIASPRSCEGSPCTPFGGTVDAIAKAKPEVVVTFGGIADSGADITDAAAEYFAALRKALPDAELVAISTVATRTQALSWVEEHSQSIRDGVESVDGVFVNVGQSGLGDGGALSSKAQAEIARKVIKKLS